eukprot:2068729-Prorocentrum_lima.AAC.1
MVVRATLLSARRRCRSRAGWTTPRTHFFLGAVVSEVWFAWATQHRRRKQPHGAARQGRCTPRRPA